MNGTDQPLVEATRSATSPSETSNIGPLSGFVSAAVFWGALL
jgi:hypothetical protein